MNKQKKIIIAVSAAVLAVVLILVIVLAVSCNNNSDTKYTILFDSRGGTEVSAITAKAGEPITEPAAPTKEFFQFLGWFQEGDTARYTFDTMPAQDLTLIARWQAEESYRITFVSNGGSQTEELIAVAGEQIEKPEDPKRDGYVFVGWFTDEALKTPFSFTAMPAADTTLYAKWSEAEGYYYVSLYVNGVNKGIYPVAAGQPVSIPEDIYDEGTVSEGWFLDEILSMSFDSATVITENLDLYSNCYTPGLRISGGVVTGITGSPKTLVIPSAYNKRTITSIGSSAFYGLSSITEVQFPAGIRTIGEYAFYNCDYLVSAVYPDTLDSIGQYAFYGCQRLRYVGGLQSVEEVPDGLFDGCKELSGVQLGANILRIGDFAFAGCNLLTEITLPVILREIGSYAFSNTGITQVALPGELSSLGTGAFNGCNIADVSVEAGNTVFFVNDGALLARKGNGLELIRYFGTTAEEYTLPGMIIDVADAGVTVKKDAFAGNSSIKKLTVKSGVTLEQGALRGLSALTELSVPTLGDGADNSFLAWLFGANKATDNGTESVCVPATLKKLTVTGGITDVPDYAFYGCRGLEEVTGMENVESIGAYAFAYTGFQSFTLPAAMTELPSTAFAGCEHLTAYDTEGGHASYTSAYGCLYSADGSVLKLVPAGMMEITFPETAFTVAKGAFEGSAITELTLPANSTLEKGALSGMIGLYTLRIPYIGRSAEATESENFLLYAFGGSKTPSGQPNRIPPMDISGSAPNTLRNVELYGNHTEIPAYGFYGLYNVSRITWPSTVTAVGSYAFGECGLIKLPLEGLKKIADHAFFACTDVPEIVVPSTVEELGEGAFYYCINLTRITFEEGVREIPNELCYPYIQREKDGSYHFYSNLTEINIPASVESIGARAFAFAGIYGELQQYEFEDIDLNVCELNFTDIGNSRLKSIGEGAFAQSVLVDVVLPASLESIGTEAFAYCPKLQSVVVGNATSGSSLTSIGTDAFQSCELLKSFTLYRSAATAQECPALERNTSGRDPFFGSDNCIFYVPAESVALYCAADGWSAYASRMQAVSADK